MAFGTQKNDAKMAKMSPKKDVDTESLASLDTIQAEKVSEQEASHKKSKRHSFFGRRPPKSEKKDSSQKGTPPKDMTQKELLQHPQGIIDEIYRRYPLAAMNSTSTR